MINSEKGFTLLEVLIAFSLFAILSLIAVSTPTGLYDRTILKSTAMEIKGALQLSQQLSLDESKTYCVELLGDRFRVREDFYGSKIIFTKNLDKNISVPKESQTSISYNRNGETSYGKFILVNKKGQKIIIDTSIGTGKVRISDIY